MRCRQMTWDSKLIKKAEEIIKLYPQKRSALGPLLYLAQNKEGYIDDDSVVEISNLLGITEVQVRSVASFYTMYKQEPTGKYLLSVCKSISCEINNSKQINSEQVSPNAEISLLKVIIFLAFTDLAFSIDSVAAAVAISDQLLLLITGAIIGVVALRFPSGLFISWLEEYEHLELAGYIAVGLVGLKLHDQTIACL